MPAAILLDLDGTLIDSEPWYKKTEVECLNRLGVPITLGQMEEFTGLTLPRWLDRIHERFGMKISQEEFLVDYQPKMTAHVADNVAIFSDAESFLQRAHTVPVAIVTSSLKWYVDAVLERFSLIRRVASTVICEADVKIGKPDPEPYLLAAERLGVDPTECLVVEDAPNGVKSGVAAGCHTVGIDRESNRHLKHAHRVVKSFSEL